MRHPMETCAPGVAMMLECLECKQAARVMPPQSHPKAATTLPTDAQARKNAPIARGVLDYFPLAIAAVAELSRIGNEQHNPGQPMHWNRAKSTDHADCIARHLIERGTIDTDNVRHSVKCAWRALALAQTELEEEARSKGTLTAKPYTEDRER